MFVFLIFFFVYTSIKSCCMIWSTPSNIFEPTTITMFQKQHFCYSYWIRNNVNSCSPIISAFFYFDIRFGSIQILSNNNRCLYDNCTRLTIIPFFIHFLYLLIQMMIFFIQIWCEFFDEKWYWKTYMVTFFIYIYMILFIIDEILV